MSTGEPQFRFQEKCMNCGKEDCTFATPLASMLVDCGDRDNCKFSTSEIIRLRAGVQHVRTLNIHRMQMWTLGDSLNAVMIESQMFNYCFYASAIFCQRERYDETTAKQEREAALKQKIIEEISKQRREHLIQTTIADQILDTLSDEEPVQIIKTRSKTKNNRKK